MGQQGCEKDAGSIDENLFFAVSYRQAPRMIFTVAREVLGTDSGTCDDGCSHVME